MAAENASGSEREAEAGVATELELENGNNSPPKRKWKKGKQCFVPECNNSEKKTPEKALVTVPTEQTLRQMWFTAAGRTDECLDKKITMYCCEDHFDMDTDFENIMRYRLLNGDCRLIKKKDLVPSRLNCHKRTIEASHSTDDTEEDGTPSKQAKRALEDTISAEALVAFGMLESSPAAPLHYSSDINSADVTEIECQEEAKAAEVKKHLCSVCGRKYGALKHLRYHFKRNHPHLPLPNDELIRGRFCFVEGCGVKLVDKFVMLNHIARFHKDIPLENKEFENMEEFMTWKAAEEKRTLARYLKPNKSTKRKDGWISGIFHCNGIGGHGSRKDLKHLQLAALDGVHPSCPAVMLMSQGPSNGRVIVNVIHYHTGHKVINIPQSTETAQPAGTASPKLDILKTDETGNVTIDLGFTKRLLEADLSSIVTWLRDRDQSSATPAVLNAEPTSVAEVTGCSTPASTTFTTSADELRTGFTAIVNEVNEPTMELEEDTPWVMNMESFETLASEISNMMKLLPDVDKESTSVYLREQMRILHSLLSSKIATHQL